MPKDTRCFRYCFFPSVALACEFCVEGDHRLMAEPVMHREREWPLQIDQIEEVTEGVDSTVPYNVIKLFYILSPKLITHTKLQQSFHG